MDAEQKGFDHVHDDKLTTEDAILVFTPNPELEKR
jgi:hypothetical protein